MDKYVNRRPSWMRRKTRPRSWKKAEALPRTADEDVLFFLGELRASRALGTRTFS
jgi:hypothetical protein